MENDREKKLEQIILHLNINLKQIDIITKLLSSQDLRLQEIIKEDHPISRRYLPPEIDIYFSIPKERFNYKCIREIFEKSGILSSMIEMFQGPAYNDNKTSLWALFDTTSEENDPRYLNVYVNPEE